MPSYDAVDFDPPAPVARARVTSSTLTAADVPMLLDTGADVSVVLGLLPSRLEMCQALPAKEGSL